MKFLLDKKGLRIYDGDTIKYHYKRYDGHDTYIDCVVLLSKNTATLKAGNTEILYYDARTSDFSSQLELVGYKAKFRIWKNKMYNKVFEFLFGV